MKDWLAGQKLENIIAQLPKNILDLDVVEIYGNDIESIHVTKMSKTLSYGLMQLFKDQPCDAYFQVGVFPEFESAMNYAESLEAYLRYRRIARRLKAT